MSTDHSATPIDPQSAARLGTDGLRLELVDTADTTAFGRWLTAEARGFYDSTPTPETLAPQLTGLADRRSTGVYDDSAADPSTPVATVSAWPTALTVPGRRSVPAWAISAVTVSPTHRRRGIARVMLEAELRTATTLGASLAILTVSEATIYSRYGFAPAAMKADWRIDTRRARWTGPAASGRVHFVTAEDLREVSTDIVERTRLGVPGQIEQWDLLRDRLLGIGADADRRKALRLVRYDDADGEPQGFAVYTVKESGPEFSSHTVDIEHLVSATDDAYAGLWRYFLEHDLVTTVTAPLRSVDEPVAWQVADIRAAHRVDQHDHLWTRILDVPAALEGRNYAGPASIVLDVDDALGFADCLVLLEIDAEGVATVTDLDGEAPLGAAALSLSVNELSALYLGGMSVGSLVRAGRITELRPGSADVVDHAFHSTVTPWLGFWF